MIPFSDEDFVEYDKAMAEAFARIDWNQAWPNNDSDTPPF